MYFIYLFRNKYILGPLLGDYKRLAFLEWVCWWAGRVGGVPVRRHGYSPPPGVVLRTGSGAAVRVVKLVPTAAVIYGPPRRLAGRWPFMRWLKTGKRTVPGRLWMGILRVLSEVTRPRSRGRQLLRPVPSSGHGRVSWKRLETCVIFFKDVRVFT